MTVAIGTKLGPYEIAGAIGRGGMDEVYRARDTRLDRTVAIKVLRKQQGKIVRPPFRGRDPPLLDAPSEKPLNPP